MLVGTIQHYLTITDNDANQIYITESYIAIQAHIMLSKRVTGTGMHWYQFRANRGNRYSPHQYWPTAVHVYMVICYSLLMLIRSKNTLLTVIQLIQHQGAPGATINYYIRNRIMITTTYYNVEQKVFNSPQGAGVWGWTSATRHDKIINRAEAEEIMVKKRQGWIDYLAKEIASATDQVIIDHLANLQANADFRIVEDVKTFSHASMYGYSDVHAYEIVKVISEKTIEVRKMSTKHDIAHLKQYTGGFCGHVANQRNQKVSYKSDPTALTIRLRRKKNNPEAWTANGQRFGLTEAPYAFYDYNF